MPLTDEQREEREDRAREHRDFVEREFTHEALPEGMTAWDHGLMVTYVSGGASDHGRIHRASCSSISKVANATTYRKNGGTYRLGREGIPARAQRCQTCGTHTLSVGARYWGDTPESIAERATAEARAGRVRDFERSLAAQEHAARNAAISEVLTRYQAEVDALAAAHLTRLQGEVRARFADVADAVPE